MFPGQTAFPFRENYCSSLSGGITLVPSLLYLLLLKLVLRFSHKAS